MDKWEAAKRGRNSPEVYGLDPDDRSMEPSRSGDVALATIVIQSFFPMFSSPLAGVSSKKKSLRHCELAIRDPENECDSGENKTNWNGKWRIFCSYFATIIEIGRKIIKNPQNRYLIFDLSAGYRTGLSHLEPVPDAICLRDSFLRMKRTHGR
jgi:hypothetical protein